MHYASLVEKGFDADKNLFLPFKASCLLKVTKINSISCQLTEMRKKIERVSLHNTCWTWRNWWFFFFFVFLLTSSIQQNEEAGNFVVQIGWLCGLIRYIVILRKRVKWERIRCISLERHSLAFHQHFQSFLREGFPPDWSYSQIRAAAVLQVKYFYMPSFSKGEGTEGEWLTDWLVDGVELRYRKFMTWKMDSRCFSCFLFWTFEIKIKLQIGFLFRWKSTFPSSVAPNQIRMHVNHEFKWLYSLK